MATLYLIEQNTVLRKSGDRLLLCKKPHGKKGGPPRVDEILLDLPCADIEHVMLFGNVQVTTQALQEMLEHGIEFAIFTYTGKLLGQLTPPQTKNIPLRIAQFQKHGDTGFVLRLAKVVVRNKIGNAAAMLREHRKNHPESMTIAEIDALEELITRADSAANLDTLRGHEGSATAAYFRLFGRMLNPPWTFTTRTRRPPKDPVNAVLSFGYVIVGTELQALLDGVGFDPYLGFYHAIEYGRPGLALDLLEEFRHPLVDRLALNLFNLGSMTQQDFAPQAAGGIYLNTSGKKKFFVQYERMLGELAAATDTAEKPSGFRAIFQNQITQLSKAILQGIDYVPFSKSLTV
jgi:CRISPR-associated protein Cas1